MNETGASPLLDCRGVNKSFKDGARELEIFRGLDLRIAPAERIAIVGRSGSGKTTLLHIVAGLEKFDGGTIHFNGKDIAAISNAERDQCLLKDIGLVFQFHFLLPDFNACENVAMPLLTAGVARGEALGRGRKMLERVGLAERATHLPSALSGGERQRVATARALVHQPRLIIADEPTGNLDGATADAMISLLLAQSESIGSSLLIATHDLNIAKRVDTCYELTSTGMRPKSFQD